MVLARSSGALEASKPAAIPELSRPRSKTECGTSNLDPPDRPQARKRVPTLPLADWLRPWIAVVPDKPRVAEQGRSMLKIANGVQAQRNSARFGETATASTLRQSGAGPMNRAPTIAARDVWMCV
jgi:hypothetical protein